MADIVIIEDEEPLVKIYTMILTKAGHNVVGAFYNGNEALQYIQNLSNWPDVIIIDQRLPGLSGIDILKSISKEAERNKTHLLFISADSLVQNDVRSLGAKFIQKPFSVIKLSSIINDILNGN